ncbi:Esterase dbaE [Cladobotryum mycophilum]|uniref:Esterase dbaE n=1 Tax=Cladobotryum mycophilum TaxID=491253 RepID=A0ABR0SJ77_9HYPO
MSADDLTLPRIFCLHGGGVNGPVFEMQLRAVKYVFKDRFRFVFVDGPYLCPPHQAIVQVYGSNGPFRRWLRWLDEQEYFDAHQVSTDVINKCREAMANDKGSGPWVGVLGFSQGAKIAASLLWAQEHMPPTMQPLPEVTFKFGVLMAGGGPVVMLDPKNEFGPPPRYVVDAAALSLGYQGFPKGYEDGKHLISTPTLHVHGLQDPGIEVHRKLLDLYCKVGTTKLVEWNGNHRLPIKTDDVAMVESNIMQMVKETGVKLNA